MNTPSSKTFTLVVGAADHGVRLDRFLTDSLSQFSRTRIKALIESGQVHIDRPPAATPSRPVAGGEQINVHCPPVLAAEPLAQAMELVVVHEDDDLIVIDKPAGLTVHPAPGNPDGTLVNGLLAHCSGSLSGIGGVARPGIVHRIDKDTSGLLVAAKHDIAHRGLAAQFEAHSVSRAYRAVIWGRPTHPQGHIEGAIGRAPNNRKKMAVVTRGGKAAITHYRLLDQFGPAGGTIASLIDCRLETGRTHQIRVHFSHIGHALIGDPLYGGRRTALKKSLAGPLRDGLVQFPRQALHAAHLGFVHPLTGAELQFDSALPEDITHLLSLLKNA